ncbi:MAG TPA: efflux RND transporter periplasmic adaptor subunit [Azospirillaceae bacterium]|nr:efflux RND transporter periplasmic adaptor subunit [Azospirillaceae bacterium]
MKARVLIGVLAVAAAAGGWWWSGGKLPGGPSPQATGSAPKGPPPVPVVLRAVEIRSAPERFTTIGSAAPIATVALKSRIDSVVEAVHFTEGQEVKTGELLFTLDDRALRAQLAQAEANLERDRAQLDKAQGDVRRYTELVRRDAVARQQFDAAIAAAAALEATVKANEAAIQSAKVALGFTRLYAPMDGRTGAVSAKPGASVRPADSAPLVTLTQLRPINVAFNVPERYLPQVRQALAAGPVAVEASISGAATPPEHGRLVFIDSQVDPLSGTILAKAEFPNQQTSLWPGQFVDVSVILRVDQGVVAAPAEAVLIGQDGRFVYVAGPDGKAEARKVAVARIADGWAVIADGLQAGEKVVVDGQSRLTPGARMAPREPIQGPGGGAGEGAKPPGTGS